VVKNGILWVQMYGEYCWVKVKIWIKIISKAYFIKNHHLKLSSIINNRNLHACNSAIHCILKLVKMNSNMMHKNKRNKKSNSNKNQEMKHMKNGWKMIDILILCQQYEIFCIKCKPKILKSYILYAKILQLIILH